MPSRRQYLLAVGAGLTGVAGCLTSDPPGTATSPAPTEPPSTTGSPRSPGTSPSTGSPDTPTSPPRDVSVSDVVVRKAIRYESVMGSGGVLAGDDRQYVVGSVRAAGELDPSAFSFETEAESWSPGLPDTEGAVNIAVAGHEGSPVGRGNLVPDRPSVLAFTVPSPLSASNPRIRYTGGDGEREWPLPAAARDRLAAPSARFELDSLTVPSSVSQGDPLSVSMTVTNVAGTAGRFLAAVYWPTKLIADDDESHVVERTVDAGETTTATVEIDTRYATNEAETLPLRVRGHVTAERQVRVTDVTTPT